MGTFWLELENYYDNDVHIKSTFIVSAIMHFLVSGKAPLP